MPRFAAVLALVCLAALVGCGGEASLDQSIDALQTSFNAKDFEAVVAAAGPLLERVQAEGGDASKAFRVEKLRLSAIARQGQGDLATEHLERLAGAYGAQVNAKLYNQVGSYVEEAGNLLEAVSVYDAGSKRFPANADAFKPRIEQLKEKATAAGDPETFARLKSPGSL